MGSQRFYCAPKGLIKKDELPSGWGLIEINEKGRAVCTVRPYTGNIGERQATFNKNYQAEHGLMYSALRRLFIKGHLDSIYDKDYSRPSVNELLNRPAEGQ
jgi:hypothetical protein